MRGWGVRWEGVAGWRDGNFKNIGTVNIGALRRRQERQLRQRQQARR